MAKRKKRKRKDKNDFTVFVSYSKFDEAHDHGKLSALCERLTDELRLNSEENVSFWLDRENLSLGSNWKDRLDEALREADLLVAFITPSYLKNKWCREELTGFLKKEKQLNRQNTIIPIIYLGNEDWLSQDALGKEIIHRKVLDWRELRFEPFTSIRLKREMKKAAGAIEDAIHVSSESD